MSKKNRSRWHNPKPVAQPSPETATKTTEPRAQASGLPVESRLLPHLPGPTRCQPSQRPTLNRPPHGFRPRKILEKRR